MPPLDYHPHLGAETRMAKELKKNRTTLRGKTTKLQKKFEDADTTPSSPKFDTYICELEGLIEKLCTITEELQAIDPSETQLDFEYNLDLKKIRTDS